MIQNQLFQLSSASRLPTFPRRHCYGVQTIQLFILVSVYKRKTTASEGRIIYYHWQFFAYAGNVLLLAICAVHTSSPTTSHQRPTRTPEYHSMLTMRVAWILLLFELSCFALKPAPPLDITRINSSNSITLKNQTKTLGLQDALDRGYTSTSTNGTITLFPNACLQSDGAPNCTAACQNHTQMFSNLETLHNCAVFPEISVHLANTNLTTSALRLVQELKIKQSNPGSSLPSLVSNAIQTCLLDSCIADSHCNRTLYTTKRIHRPNNLTGILFIDNDFFPLCSSVPAFVNADVGGIGVWTKSAFFSTSVDNPARYLFPMLCRWG